jgi:hypothetical protein
MVKAAARILRDLVRHQLYHPTHAWIWLRRRRPRKGPLCHDGLEDHLRAAVQWLLRAHRVTGAQGVAARYTFMNGWTAAYPETTGYIIPTLLDCARRLSEPMLTDAALEMADWLLSIQLKEGGFPGGHLDQNQGPVVFNTGQIMIGLLAAYRETGGEAYLDAARRAGLWLAEIQDEDGAWRKCTYKDRHHAYHTRVAWPAVDTGLETGERKIVEAGRANLDFALTLQEENGWFRDNTLDEEEAPFTHTLAYVTRGLLEGGVLLEEEKYIDSARKLALALCRDFESRGFLPGQYDQALRPVESFSCLTGNAQMAVVWWKLHRLDGIALFADAAVKASRQVMHCQDIHIDNADVRGGVPGSWPIEGPYIRFGYPNWAAKFLIDALLFEL